MLIHIVIWKYKSETPAEERLNHLTRLRELSALVPGIESFRVGCDTLHLARSYDLGVVAAFRDRRALDEYTLHPQHVAVAEFGRSISQHVASVDFEQQEA